MSALWTMVLGGAALLVGAWTAAAEVALFSANRLRLRHLARSGARGAADADALLAAPARLITLLALLGAGARLTLAAAALAFGWRLAGAAGALLTIGLALLASVLLVELMPRALAAPRAERYARRAAPALRVLARILGPLLDGLVLLNRGLTGGRSLERAAQQRGAEELATARPLVAGDAQRALADDLLLLSATVADAMVPRADVVGIDVDAPWDEVVRGIEQAPHRVLVVHRGQADEPIGMLTVRRALALLRRDALDRQALLGSLAPPYFVPAATPLQSQLVEFQRAGRDVALVVDEYGTVLGLITLADVVAELASALGAGAPDGSRGPRPDREGCYLIGGQAHLRTLNRTLGWELPTDGPRTINGLLLEHLEAIPPPGTTLRIAGFTFEVLQTSGAAVKTVRIRPPAE
jgi:Mg2+/Co2+ transporter CorB